MFILFDAQCPKCRKPFKAEADTGSESPPERGQYRCACPRCYAAVTIRGEQGAAAAISTSWAVRAAAVSGTSAARADPLP